MIQKSTMLIIGGTGKTGRRVANHLVHRGHEVRIGSRSADPAFLWEDEANWKQLLDGVNGIYIAHPDNTHPDAGLQLEHFSRFSLAQGVKRQVLLSGRADETFLESAERGFRESGADWTILRPSWFMQNFSEMFFLEAVLAGEIKLPVGDATEPFIDIEDIAAVAAEALLNDRHIGQVYELTGPELISFEKAAEELTKVIGRKISFEPITFDEFRESILANGLPEEYCYMYADIANGKLAYVTDDVERVLGRQPRRFSDYAIDAASSGAWNV